MSDLTKKEDRKSGLLVDAFNAAAVGVDNDTICIAIGRLTWQHADEDGKTLFRQIMRRTEHERG